MFIDQIKVFARAGHGGKGSVSFLREAFRPKGGPAGGNGGRGGDVYLEADHDINNLVAQFYQPRLLAEDGAHGMGKNKEGLAGKDLLIKVPCGTLVWRLTPKTVPGVEFHDVPEETPETDEEDPSSEEQQRGVIRYAGDERALEIDLEADENAGSRDDWRKNAELVADLTEHGQRVLLCKGGRGGLGNKNFATARHQTPRFAQPGESGEEGEFLFELRIIAEVGLVGYPNAGKSTLLTAVSRARPKIAAYPFTTLHPQIGIAEYEDFKRLTFCDVPGLIEGAHNNVGLGHEFLRHISRCRVLAIIVDMAGTDGRHPWDDYRQILNELELYEPALLEKPHVIVANKMDEPAAVENLVKFRRRIRGIKIIKMAAAFDEGVEEFKTQLREMVEALAREEES